MRGRPVFLVCLFILVLRGIWLVFFFSGEESLGFPGRKSPAGEIVLRGEIYRIEETDKTKLLYLKHNSIFQGKDSFPTSNCIVYDSKKQNYQIGNIVKVEGEAKIFENAPNPGNFDQKLYYQKDGLLFSCFAKKISVERKTINQAAQFFYQFRRKWSNMLVHELGEKHGGTLSAMLIGEKKTMDAGEKEIYQKSGIGHLLAVSGLHVSFVGLSFYELLRRVGTPFFAAGAAGIGVLFFYGMLTGFGVSVTRAVIMLAFRIGASLGGREYDFPTAIGFAAAWTALTKPLYLLDAGFLLSYISVIGIYVGDSMRREYFPDAGSLFQSLWMGAAVQIALFPITLYFYYEFPTYSILLNLAAIPGSSIVIGNGMLASIFCMISGSGVGLRISGWLLEIYSRVSEASLHLPWCRIVFGKPRWHEILVYYLVLSLLYLMIKRKWEKRWGVALLFSASVLFLKRIPYPHQSVNVTMINVGQGDCALIQSPDRACYLVDGGSSDVDEVGKYRIEPFLKYLGIGKVDGVFLSHADEDHINGIYEMLERQHTGIAIETVVLESHSLKDKEMRKLAARARKYGTEVKKISWGKRLGKKMILSCAGPKETFEGKDGNENSMVLRMEYGDMSMLFTGDIGQEAEREMLMENMIKPATILKTAHHGSKNSTSSDFLKILKPKAALISAGVKNRYGHPNEETLERLRKEKIPYYVTNSQGAICVRFTKEGCRLYHYSRKGIPFPF
ncbi:DNA internalization-related competence protein ComEC/Rec2 [Lachnoclostridium sp. An181]|uniref:DNA internalization-related competence protein ComEC/Rec2 n=1 Tax=Lachnoclostridium sp. An181 TaxID=1965575 RepID=UPI000B39F015|nr:DNA internalization-related competence protein ComEC/Rec2 [Lachnoclostridium sp. An181]OUP51317.1 DNA internalization-related competence protein ComEC/Rec2 [Lachnoclostridium sp. An181]